ncbi:MAG: semialdehyde dehydrogenase, partial [Chloroflexi bacterium]|nr:semialdehyde dehydrogenase [Chloroflexota bacterium]
MTKTIALFGAAGKIGTRISNRLASDENYRTLYVEAGEGALARLRERGLTPTPRDAAVAQADVVILAVPDTLIGRIAADVVPLMRRDT